MDPPAEDRGRARLLRLLAQRLPGVEVLRRYQRACLGADLVGGLTVGAMLVPQAMGYAALAGLAPEYGFYAAIPALCVYALAGSSRHLGVGPEPGTAILAAAAVGGLAGGDAGRYAALMAALALVVAALSTLGAALRLGHLASLLSRPVLVGYISGVGLTLLASQIGPFTGAPITAEGFLARWAQLAGRLDRIDPATALVGGLGLALVLGLRWKLPTAPGALVAVAAATLLTAAAGLDGVALVGAIPAGLPTPVWPGVAWSDVVGLVPAAAGITLVGFTDNVLTARAVARQRGYSIDPNQELLALGAINLSAGLAGGFPISSSASRTVVPASLGSRTQLVSIVAAVFTASALVWFRAPLSAVPRPALAAVIAAAALHIIDVKGFSVLWRLSRTEAALAVAAAAGVVLLGVLPGVLVAVGLSLAVALGRIARPHDAVLGDAPGLDGWVDVGEYPTALASAGLLVFRFDAPLFFLNIERFAERVELALADNPGDEEWLVLDCEGIGALDVTAVDGLAELAGRLAQRRLAVIAVARANERVLALLRRAGLLEPDGPFREFPTINSAVRAFRAGRA
ncbi:MAG: SulP family inorganic anion transporter [Acidimicrobiales bacterium]